MSDCFEFEITEQRLKLISCRQALFYGEHKLKLHVRVSIVTFTESHSSVTGQHSHKFYQWTNTLDNSILYINLFCAKNKLYYLCAGNVDEDLAT